MISLVVYTFLFCFEESYAAYYIYTLQSFGWECTTILTLVFQRVFSKKKNFHIYSRRSTFFFEQHCILFLRQRGVALVCSVSQIYFRYC